MGIPSLDARLARVCLVNGFPWQQQTNFTASDFQGVVRCWRGTLVKWSGFALISW